MYTPTPESLLELFVLIFLVNIRNLAFVQTGYLGL